VTTAEVQEKGQPREEDDHTSQPLSNTVRAQAMRDKIKREPAVSDQDPADYMYCLYGYLLQVHS